MGSARTALVAWARARSEGGALVLRVEDLDPPRVVPGAEEAMRRDLAWLGLDWDEGPDVGGAHAPYVQSARLGRYAAAVESLRARGLVYPCTCSRKEIASVASAPHGPDDEGPRYPGTCRDGPTHPERAPAWRFRMPDPSPGFDDAVHGAIAAGCYDSGDFVVRRADGVFAYQLAVVVDDLEMRITEVVRGDDLLSSTPKQLALFAALAQGTRALSGARGPRVITPAPPAWLHVPLVLDARGERLGKRHGSLAIAELHAAGVTPEELVGKLAETLGLAAPGERLTARDVAARFDVTKLPREAVRVSDAWLPRAPGT